ncbi:P-type cation-transporting ATPase [Tolypocladium capitatum]|uniref:P-type cation-transporting ATPase n=1 Tax=Tolypocladium capitatum TaxID=45235 RepID=A0A2K3QJR1_9HYPO|nr:P-type cation-transporting ATPase [Tolypocladium capitatum]
MGCSCCGPPATPLSGDSQSALEAHDDGASDGCVPSPDDDAGAAQVEAASVYAGINKPDAPSGSCCAGCCGADEPSSDHCGSGYSTSCADACCQRDSAAAYQSKADTTICTDGCGNDEPAVATTLAACQDSEPACNDGCCGAEPPEASAAADKPDVADCCRGKLSPCCDESCLDRLALRECADRTCAGEIGETGDASFCNRMSSDGRMRNACGRHRRSARERYGATLEAIGCICSALIALGQESCCEARTRPSAERKGLSKCRSASSLSCPPLDSCCATGASTKMQVAVKDRRQKRGPVRKSSEIATVARSRPAVDSCCASEKTHCGPVGVTSTKPAVTEKTRPLPDANDAENQAAGSEHVALCVSGMTCTGCETKLNRTLATLAGVKNLKTSLVLSRAEFDVELSLVTVDDIVKHLERTTEFKCERISSNGSTMEILVPGDVSVFINGAWPAGVIDMSQVGKDTIQVTFDPKLVGARDLVDKHWRKSVRLASIRGDPGLEAGGKHVCYVGYMTLLSAILTIPVLVMAWAPLPKREIAYGSASLALATIVQVSIAGPFYPKALKALVFSRVVEMDLLIVLSTSAAYIFSVVSFGYLVAGRPLSTGQFFETNTLLVTLIMVGRYVAALARQKAVESISIRSLQASNALLVDGANASSEREIDARLLQYGDFFKVLPDSRIPTDGTVVAGSSEVDESMLTGESLPVEKQVKSHVIAGTINGSGTLVIRLTRLPGDNTITAIAAMVDEAKLSKPKLQELADRVASYFVPVVVTLAIMTFVVWVAVGMALRGKSGSAATVDATTFAITVLIVSCPCAIGLAVPMVVVIASGAAAERGVIFKSAGAIEVAYKTSHVVFDKTGTLTQGRLTVASEHCATDKDTTLELLLGLIDDNRHPVSLAVANHLRSKGVTAAVVSGTRSLTGKGLEAQVAGQTLRAGNSRWLQSSSDATVESVLAQNHTAFCFTIDGALAAVFGLEDSLRADAAHVVSDLRKRGISVHVLSGDDDGAVRHVAAKLNIPGSNTHARCSPADKQAYIKGLLGNSPKGKKPTVIFCGDGTNDAVALAQATIGVHMNEGSDVAQSAADVVLMRPELSGILTIMNTSKRSVDRIKLNFGWSFVYNTFAVLLAAGVFVNARIPPEFAGLGELVSVLPVIAAAVLLRWSRD